MWSDECQIKGSLPSACCPINTVSMLFAIFVARVNSWLTFSSISAGHLRPFPAELLHSQSMPSMYFFEVYFLSTCRTLHLSLNFMRFLSATITLFFRSEIYKEEFKLNGAQEHSVQSDLCDQTDYVYLSFLTTFTVSGSLENFAFKTFLHCTCTEFTTPANTICPLRVNTSALSG